MRERSVWRWVMLVLLFALGLLLVASLPSEALARFFDHPAHPWRRGPGELSRSLEGARWLRFAAIATAVGWVAGAMLLARLRSDQDRPARPSIPFRELLALAGIVVVAMLVRMPFLVHSLWFDEIASIGDFVKYGPGPILGAWFTPSNHVLQSLLSWVSATAFDASEPMIRLPSLLAGLFTVAVVYALGRRVGGASLALVAAGVMALMPVAVLESTEARGYALAMLFAAVGAWAFVRGAQDGEPWTWAVMAAAGALATWSHLVASLATIGFAVVALVDWTRSRGNADRRRRAQSAIVGTCMAGMLALTMLAPLLPDVIEGRAQFRSVEGSTPTLASAEGLRFALMLGGTWAVALPPLLAALPGVVLFVVGLAMGWRARPARLALAASLAGLPLLLLIAGVGGSWAYARFASFTMPGAAIAIGMGIVTAARLHPRAALVAAAMLAASFACELALAPPRQPIRDAVLAMDERAAPDDLVVDLGIRGNVSSFYAHPDRLIAPSGTMGAELEARLALPRVRWVVMTYPRRLPPERRAALEAHGFRRIGAWPGWIDWGEGGVELWARDRGAAARPS